MRWRRPLWLWAACAALLAAGGAAHARGQLQVRPLVVELQPEGGTRLVLANIGTAPVAAQMRIVAWTQPDGDDAYEASDAVVVSPSIAEIAPGAEQTVRVLRLGAAAAGTDRSYRVVVDELPDPDAGRHGVVAMRMRYLLPMFDRAPGAPAPALRCTLARAVLECRNEGGRAAQLSEAVLRAAGGGERSLSPGLFGYVLPGSRRRWVLDGIDLAAFRAAGTTLRARLNGDPVQLPVGTAD